MNFIYVLICSFVFVSCGSGHPPFDSSSPDTSNNAFHFENLLHLEISSDVSSLYSYGSEMGIDASYYLAFKCSNKTRLKIIDANKMILDSDKGIPLSSSLEMPWWNKSEIKSLQRYSYSNENKTYFKYFWYNQENENAYFLDFDL